MPKDELSTSGDLSSLSTPPGTAGVPAISIAKVSKSYSPTVHALTDVSLDIADNEFFTLLGPSGCGKTTLLRLVAGFEDLTSGEISLFGAPIGALPPNLRPVNTVFQHFALFPHMTVAENVAFGLRRLKRAEHEIASTVSGVLDMVRLASLRDRYPRQLSGGQQQRVALARALAPKPRVLLLDEPLSALDLKLRQQMRVELKQLQEETGITFVFVTHDQEEALAMSDRIAVLSEGRIQQLGTASDIYEHPVNRFVAEFIGETNIFSGTITRVSGRRAAVRIADGIEVSVDCPPNAVPGAKVSISVRPEKLSLTPADGKGEGSVIVRRRVFLGTDTLVHVTSGDVQLIVRIQNSACDLVHIAEGCRCKLVINPLAPKLLFDRGGGHA